MHLSSVLFVVCFGFHSAAASYAVPRCGDEVLKIAATRTVVQTNFIPITTTTVQVIAATSLITRTTHFSSTVSQVQFVTLFQEPVLVPETLFVTQTRLLERNLVYTSTDFTAAIVTESHVAADVLPVYLTEQGVVTSTLLSVVVVPNLQTSHIFLTNLVTETSYKTSLNYQPQYVTKTQTKSYLISRTVYQRKISKSTIDVVKTSLLTSTVYHCTAGYMNQFFGF